MDVWYSDLVRRPRGFVVVWVLGNYYIDTLLQYVQGELFFHHEPAIICQVYFISVFAIKSFNYNYISLFDGIFITIICFYLLVVIAVLIRRDISFLIKRLGDGDFSTYTLYNSTPLHFTVSCKCKCLSLGKYSSDVTNQRVWIPIENILLFFICIYNL